MQNKKLSDKIRENADEMTQRQFMSYLEDLEQNGGATKKLLNCSDTTE